ncbi:MAG: hypothetical protein KC729_07390 [Candidatus Eisenbacteria bacterium]|uniref:Uncharacterized protein n=1 Tax=Eiseniibacteriota bacterium TaxID=2212470 RepID=A0A956M076_UNCEI|nr:hypothetical protein [Candidatus Eisenbacteria bacterium]
MARRPWIRNLEAGVLYETFLVAAVASVLGIRFFLRLTGYPQLGGEQLHIAHMLWGGFLLTGAVVIQLGFLGRTARWTAALLGGVGFGTFIDELGKFITQDNDYFYRPTAALIYVLFVLLYVTTWRIRTGRKVSPQEYLVNALQEMEEVALIDLDEEERRRALRHLSKSDPTNPLVRPLTQTLETARVVPTIAPPWLERLKRSGRRTYARVSGIPAFSRILAAFFAMLIGIKLYHGLIEVPLRRWGPTSLPILGLGPPLDGAGLLEWLEVTSSFVSGGLMLIGLIQMRRSRLHSYGWFKRAVLVSIFLTQVFQFYREQFVALTGLALQILLLWMLDYAIEQERLEHPHAGESDATVRD